MLCYDFAPFNGQFVARQFSVGKITFEVFFHHTLQNQ